MRHGCLRTCSRWADDGRYPQLSLSPQQRRRKTLDALVAQIEGLSRRVPTLLIFEDAQWADPSSLETLDRLVDRIEGLNALLIVTYRPEFAPAWIGRPHVTVLTLSRLTRSEIAEMVRNVAGYKSLPETVALDIVERAGGVPLFAEEITKAILEAAEDGAAPACAFADIVSTAPALPASLQASLLARLDRLGAARDIVQMAAAIGHEFSYALLARVMEKSWGRVGFWLSTTWSKPGCWCGTGSHQMQPMSSNIRFVRTSPTARCCGTPDERCTRASPRRWNTNHLIWLHPNPKSLPANMQRRG